MCDTPGNDTMLIANDMLHQQWTYLCGPQELYSHAALFCHHLGCLTSYCSLVHSLLFLTNLRKGHSHVCWVDWTPAELLLEGKVIQL